MFSIKCSIEKFDDYHEDGASTQMRYLYQINDFKLDRVFTFYHYTTAGKRDKRNPENERKQIARSLRTKRNALRDHYDLVKNPIR